MLFSQTPIFTNQIAEWRRRKSKNENIETEPAQNFFIGQVNFSVNKY